MKTKLISLLLLIIISSNQNLSFCNYFVKDSSIVQNNNQFALELYSEISLKPGNIILSPFSISSALAMTYAGARSETEKQMSNVMHFAMNQDLFHNDYRQLSDNIEQLDNEKGIEINIANSLWAQKNYSFLDKFLKLTKKYYSAGLQFVDFVKETEKSRKLINQWVEKETKQKIKDLLLPGTIDQSTVLVLTNAIYFYGIWENKFDTKNTYKSFFYKDDKTKVETSFMKQSDKFNYYEDNTLQALELPYSNNSLSMVIMLPALPLTPSQREVEQTYESINKFEKLLTYEMYNNIISGFRKRKVNVSVPKFKITSQFDLEEKLSQMGMPDAFSSSADFSGMTGKKDLHIDKVVHKAFIEVNEEGTEAAAATAVIMTKSAAIAVTFKADHPYVFIIKDNNTESILFIGRVAEPID